MNTFPARKYSKIELLWFFEENSKVDSELRPFKSLALLVLKWYQKVLSLYMGFANCRKRMTLEDYWYYVPASFTALLLATISVDI